MNRLIKSLKNGFVGDLIFKMTANIISTIVRNIVVLPFLANMFLSAEYGELVTVIGVITTITASFGNALLSARLVMDSKYRDSHLEGDFNVICLIVSFISLVFALPIVNYFDYLDSNQLIFVALLLFTETFVGYHSGWFILRQAYRKLLIYTLVNSIGFGIGLVLSKITGFWTLTYLTSDVFSMFFLIRFSPLAKEKYKFTQLRPVTINKYFILIMTTLISNALSYLDRLMLYPVMGSEAVAVYSTASVFGKAFNLIAIPISSIMLGYYASGKVVLNRKKYWYINFTVLGLLTLFLVVTRICGIWFTGLLYPSIIDAAAPYVLIANLSSAIGASAQITKSAALKYAKTYWTLVIQSIYAAIYIGLGYYMVVKDGLRGFAYAILVANVVQLFMLYIICHLSLQDGKGEKM